MPENIENLLNEILKEIKPTPEEVAIQTEHANEITNRLRRVVPKDVEIRVEGSFAHGTNLKGASDLDIFLLFNKKLAKETITRLGLEYAKKILSKGDKIEIKYAEHPYARLSFASLNVEADIVPAYKIESAEEMATTVDRSPMHTEFILSHFDEKQRDEVRLLKYFLMNHWLYGAEVAVGGFSGYLCELLIYAFGTFLSTLKFFAGATLPIIIEPKTKQIIKDIEPYKRFNSQFIVIDPVDKNRNVAAAVSLESLARFVSIARAFLSRPTKRAFYGYAFSHQEAKEALKSLREDASREYFLIETKVPDKSEDILWPQLRKVAEEIKAYAEKFGFEIDDSIPIIDERQGLIFVIAPYKRLKARLLKGPDVFIRSAADKFIEAHKRAMGIMVRGTTLYALEENRHASLEDVLNYVCKGGLKARHKDIPIKGARLYANKVPDRYIDTVYAEIKKRLRAAMPY